MFDIKNCVMEWYTNPRVKKPSLAEMNDCMLHRIAIILRLKGHSKFMILQLFFLKLFCADSAFTAL